MKVAIATPSIRRNLFSCFLWKSCSVHRHHFVCVCVCMCVGWFRITYVRVFHVLIDVLRSVRVYKIHFTYPFVPVPHSLLHVKTIHLCQRLTSSTTL